jgi:hypothetical protein
MEWYDAAGEPRLLKLFEDGDVKSAVTTTARSEDRGGEADASSASAR